MEKYNIKSDVESCHDIYRNYLQKTKSFQPKQSSFNAEEPSFHPKDRKEWIAARKTAKFYSRRIGRELKEAKESVFKNSNNEEHQELIRLLKLRLDFALAIEHAIEVAKTSQSSIAEKEVLKLKESIFLIVSPSDSRNLYDGQQNPDEDSSLTNSDNSTITSQEDNIGSSLTNEDTSRPVRVSGVELRDDYEMDNLYAHNNSKAYTDEELEELCIKSGLSPISTPRCLSPSSPHSSTLSSPRSSYSSGKKTIGILNRVIEEENDDSDAIEEEKDGERTPSAGGRTRKSRRFAFIVPSIKDGPAVSLHEMKDAQKKVNSSVVLTMNNPLREKLLNLKEPEYDGDSSRPVSQSSFYSAATSHSAYSGSSASSNGDGMSYRIPELGKEQQQPVKNNKQLKKEAEQKRKEEEKRKKAEKKAKKQQEKEEKIFSFSNRQSLKKKAALAGSKDSEKKRTRSFSFGKLGKTLGKIFSFSASSGAKSDSEIGMSRASSRDDGNSSSDEGNNDPNNAVVPVRWSSFSWGSNTSSSTAAGSGIEKELMSEGEEEKEDDNRQQQLMNSNGKKPSFAEMRRLAIKNNTRSASKPVNIPEQQPSPVSSNSSPSSTSSSPRTSAGSSSSSSSSATPAVPYDYESSMKSADSLLYTAQRAENSASASQNQLKWKEISKSWEECISFCEKQFDLCCKSRDSETSRYRNEWNRKLSYMIKEKHRWNEKMKSLSLSKDSSAATTTAAEGLTVEKKPMGGNLSSFFFPEDHDDELEASYFPPSYSSAYSSSAVTSPANSRPSSMKWPSLSTENNSDGNGSISSSEKKLKSKGSLRVSFKDDKTTTSAATSPVSPLSTTSSSSSPVSPLASLSPVSSTPVTPVVPVVSTRPIPSQAMLSPVPQPAVFENVEPTELGKQQDKFQRNKMKRQLDKVNVLASSLAKHASSASPKAIEEVKEKWSEVIAGFETSYHEALPLFKGFWKEEVERVKKLREDSMTSINGKSLQ
jgi:hypothetical protein